MDKNDASARESSAPIPDPALSSTTPMMRQWNRVKAQHPDALLLFRMGDFYEMFGDDAVTAARELEVTLTARSRDPDAVPMCGVPFHAAERYIAQLLSKGYRCAICDQVEDPKYARGLVKREITRVLSPGTLIEDSFLQSVGAAKGNNFLAALTSDAAIKNFGLALLDISTGEFLAGQVETAMDARDGCTSDDKLSVPKAPASTYSGSNGLGDDLDGALSGAVDVTPDAAENTARWAKLREDLLRFEPAEVLVPQNLRECAGFLDFLREMKLHITPFDRAGFDSGAQKLQSHFRTSSLRGFGIENLPLAQESAALALDYLGQTHLGALGHIRRVSLLSTEGWMLLDNATRRNLELVQSLRDGSAKGTLLGLLDETRTGAGARLLRKWVLQPLLHRERIENRQDAVSELLDNLLLRRDVRDLLKSISDIERLVSRSVTGAGNARDLVALRTSLEAAGSRALVNVREHLDPAPELLQVLEESISDEPPAILTEGNLIREGFDEELDKTRVASREGKMWIAMLEESERARTGIKSLKVGFNNVFGYYIEVTKINLANVPADYTRKQTTANAERFVTPELKEKEALILGADERMKELEKRLFERVRDQVAGHAGPLMTTARALAHIDVYAGLAEVASRRDYVRPEIMESDELDIRGGRHPVVEAMSELPFVPNDCILDRESQQVLIITGPNASGKSTFLRQVALIALMAQVGSFVPARSAKIGLVDRIFTRVGAQDDLATGQSTFTVEMNETANILNNATPRSLVILDEVGRGTSTYDGLSIAWAVAEHLHEAGPKTLFATHYHHLNELEERLPRAKNFRIAVKEDGEHIIFLRRIIRGGTDRSFGIQVARLAGLPESVIKRSRELLEAFSKERLRGQHVDTSGVSGGEVQAQVLAAPASLFDGEANGSGSRHPVVEELKGLDVDNLTPLEAIVKLQELRKKALS